MWSGTKLDTINKTLGFKYNICTCGAMFFSSFQTSKSLFKYNICTCGAYVLIIFVVIKIDLNTTFVHVERLVFKRLRLVKFI